MVSKYAYLTKTKEEKQTLIYKRGLVKEDQVKLTTLFWGIM